MSGICTHARVIVDPSYYCEVVAILSPTLEPNAIPSRPRKRKNVCCLSRPLGRCSSQPHEGNLSLLLTAVVGCSIVDNLTFVVHFPAGNKTRIEA